MSNLNTPNLKNNIIENMETPEYKKLSNAINDLKKSFLRVKNTKSEMISSDEDNRFLIVNTANKYISSITFDTQDSSYRSFRLRMAGGNIAEIDLSVGTIEYSIGDDKRSMGQNSTNRVHETGPSQFSPIPVDMLKDFFVSIGKQLNQITIKEKQENAKNISKSEILDIISSAIDIKDFTRIFNKDIFISLQQYIKSNSFSINELNLVKKGLLLSYPHPGHEKLISRLTEICKSGGYSDLETKQIIGGKDLGRLSLDVVGTQILMIVNDKSGNSISEIPFSYDKEKFSPNKDDGKQSDDFDGSNAGDLETVHEALLGYVGEFSKLMIDAYRKGSNLISKGSENRLILNVNKGGIKTISCDDKGSFTTGATPAYVEFNDGTKITIAVFMARGGRNARISIDNKSGVLVRQYTIEDGYFIDSNQNTLSNEDDASKLYDITDALLGINKSFSAKK